MRLLALSCFLFSITSFSHSLGFPDGEYRGEGYWRDDYGAEGSYSAIVELWNDEIWLNYSWEHEGERSEIAATLSFWLREDGKDFDVAYNGLWAGEGSLEGGIATYSANIEGWDIWETISYNEVGLHKSGYKSKDDEVIHWSEWLYPWSGSEPEPGTGTGQWGNGQGQGQTGDVGQGQTGDVGQGQTGGDPIQGGSDDHTGVVGGGGPDYWPVPEEGVFHPGMGN